MIVNYTIIFCHKIYCTLPKDNKSFYTTTTNNDASTTQRLYTSSHLNKQKKFNDSATIFKEFAAILDGFAAIFGVFVAIFDDFAVIFEGFAAILRRFCADSTYTTITQGLYNDYEIIIQRLFTIIQQL